MPSPDLVLAGSYDHGLVALSVVIAVLASYTALDLAGRVTATHGRARLIWLAGGATAMGIGIWSMHYVGMLAFSLPVPVQYDWPMVLLALSAGVLSAALALFVVSRERMGAPRAVSASLFMGGAIAAVHYTGMAAMRLPAMCHYSPLLVALSVALAIAFSLIALWLTFYFRDEAGGRMLRKGASAVLMGAAITDMHYTAMAAASFVRSAEIPDLSHAISISSLGAAAIAMATLMVLAITLVTCLVDRLEKQRALLDGLFEQAPEALTLISADHCVVRVNREFTRVFGYTSQEIVGRRLIDLIVPDELRDEFQRFADLVAHGQRVDAESIRRRKDGGRLPVSMVRVPVSVPGGQIVEYEIYHDITERKRAEEDLRRSFEQLRALAAHLQSVREEERTRVAREIHDELGQALTAIKLDLTALLRDLPPDQEPAVRRCQSSSKLLDEAIQSVRRIATDLRPGVLDDLGLVAAVEWAVDEFQARTGIQCHVSLPDVDIAMDAAHATALFRIFQETLTNVARHANATQVNVRLDRQNGDLSLEVRDDGKGIPEKQISAGQSLGILGMRERALLLGGELTISGGPGKGTIVKVRIPNIHGN